MVSSKTGFIVLITQLITLLYIIYKNIRLNINRFLIVSITMLCIPVSWMLTKDTYLITRYSQALGTMGIVKAQQTEGSTSSRIGEIEGVLHNLSSSWVTALFGMGNGAWIPSGPVEKYMKTNVAGISGLNHKNYRGNGKYIHHVHSSVFAIMHRNGIIGMIFYFYYFYYLIKLSKSLLKCGASRFRYYTNDKFFVYTYGLGLTLNLVAGIVSIFPSSGIYGSIWWGSQVAMISIAIKYLTNEPHKIPYNLNYHTQ